MTDTKHEAPAKGLGEDDLTLRGLATLISGYARDRDREGLPQTAETLRHAALVIDHYRELRARSSAPEAREEALGNLLAVIHGDGGHRALEVGTKQAALEAEKIVAGLFAAPSADKLRIAVEALGLTKSRIQTWPIDDQETCMCGSPVSGHGMGDGHSPVSQGDHAVSMLVEEIDQALATLKAEVPDDPI